MIVHCLYIVVIFGMFCLWPPSPGIARSPGDSRPLIPWAWNIDCGRWSSEEERPTLDGRMTSATYDTHPLSRPNLTSSIGLCGGVSLWTRAEGIVEPACRTGTEVLAGGLVLVVSVKWRDSGGPHWWWGCCGVWQLDPRLAGKMCCLGVSRDYAETRCAGVWEGAANFVTKHRWRERWRIVRASAWKLWCSDARWVRDQFKFNVKWSEWSQDVLTSKGGDMMSQPALAWLKVRYYAEVLVCLRTFNGSKYLHFPFLIWLFPGDWLSFV
jgi:hypothetical protein